MNRPTRTSATERAYVKLAKMLVIKAERELNLYGLEPIHPVEFVKWLRNQKSHITKNTFRIYKAATVFHFSLLAETEPAYEEAVEILRYEPQTGCLRRGKGMKSSKKAKNIPKPKFDRLVAALNGKRSVWAKRAALIINAGVRTGLRPVEWESARFNGDETELAVRNAKATNGRANGDFRTLAINDQSRSIIKSHLNEIWGFLDEGGKFEDYLGYCSNAMRRTVIQLFGFGVHYTLYSTRHQYSANMKNVASRKEVARRMGHNSIGTAERHYGKRRSGWAEYDGQTERETDSRDNPT
jgi:integrase